MPTPLLQERFPGKGESFGEALSFGRIYRSPPSNQTRRNCTIQVEGLYIFVVLSFVARHLRITCTSFCGLPVAGGDFLAHVAALPFLESASVFPVLFYFGPWSSMLALQGRTRP